MKLPLNLSVNNYSKILNNLIVESISLSEGDLNVRLKTVNGQVVTMNISVERESGAFSFERYDFTGNRDVYVYITEEAFEHTLTNFLANLGIDVGENQLTRLPLLNEILVDIMNNNLALAEFSIEPVDQKAGNFKGQVGGRNFEICGVRPEGHSWAMHYKEETGSPLWLNSVDLHQALTVLVK